MSLLQQEITSFFKYIKSVYHSNVPFVVFKKPSEHLLAAYVQNTTTLHFLTSFSEQGFVFAPFDERKKKVFFPKSACKIVTSIFSSETNDNKISKTLLTSNENEVNTKNKHIKLVEKGIDFIKSGKAKKIVLSRKEEITCQKDIFEMYKNMLYLYPTAFVYVLFHPAVGLWMGATPERLLSVKGTTFKTMALAGTQYNKNTDKVFWGQKEQQEQQFVTDFIVKSTKPYLKNIKISKPFTVEAGNLVHIKTDISGELINSNVLSKLISSLHPTPAVCGLPKEIATTFIVDNESYSRDFYTGFLGEINTKNSTELFVNLRCMELKNNKAIIYIGGGITKDSNAENEWKETVAKSKVMKKVL